MSFSSTFADSDHPMDKVDVAKDTKGIENLLLSQGFADCEPGVVNKLLMQGYAMFKDNLLRDMARAELAKAVGNTTVESMDTESETQEADATVIGATSEWAMDVDMDISGPGTSTSAMNPNENLAFPAEFLTTDSGYGGYEIQQDLGDIDMEMQSHLDSSAPAPSTSAINFNEHLHLPAEFLATHSGYAWYEIQQEPFVNLGDIDMEMPSNVDNTVPAPSTPAIKPEANVSPPATFAALEYLDSSTEDDSEDGKYEYTSESSDSVY
ncbi:uncharacterized protein LOC111068996 [Drosophila obscura]|uniref:uncharacterized protein LOC111068996 n=1 Tax=Drosophila obscura TaxID=7282 RepID=UPI000BA144BA|nr:uncharacterized protein LOC111068996 [Drosophila obscura]XP_022214562.1 uncharacterized protein LOC111068996 [Drosophila obscura]